MESNNEKNKIDWWTVSLLFFAVSLFGWVFETIVCYLQSGEFSDRGFLILPFCPIYGLPVCVIYYLFGRPTSGLFYQKIMKRRGQVRVFYKIVSVLIYFFAAGLIATAVELSVGLILRWAGLSLWSYNGSFLCVFGLVCLPVSLLWGAMITLFAQCILPPIERLFVRIPKKIKVVINVILWVVIFVDFACSVGYYVSNGRRFKFEI